MAAIDTSTGRVSAGPDKAGSDKAAAAPAAKRKSKKPLLFGLVGVLILGAAGVAAWFVLFAGAEDEVTEVDAPPVIEAPLKVDYITLKPIFVPVKTSSGSVTNVVVSLMLEVEKGSGARTQVESSLPRLYEAYLRALTDRPLPGAETGKVEITHIKNRVRAENLRLLGPGVVHDVIVNSVWDPAS